MHSRHFPPPLAHPHRALTTRPDFPPLTIREYRAGDEAAILETFNEVFRQVDPGFEGRTMEEWRWRYLENPSGWRIWLATAPDGSVVSQYAGVAQRVLLEGSPAHFSQAVDSMTDPAWRRGLKKPGFFVLTGYPYAENYGGPPPDKDTIMWGLPIPSAWRIGKTYLDYELIRTQLKLVCPLENLDAGGAGGAEVEEVECFPEEILDLFQRAAEPWGAMAVRDAEQLNWRFVQRPGGNYKIALVRGADGLRGMAVYGSGVFDGDAGAEPEGLVCDWLVRPGDDGASAALLAWLAEVARADGRECLTALFPDTAPDWIAFQEAGFRVHPTRYFLVGRNYVNRYRMRWLYQNWYYTLGDTDLC